MFLLLIVLVCLLRGSEMFSLLTAFLTTHASGAFLGSALGLVELATPMMTRASRVRRGARVLRSIGGRVFGRAVSEEEAANMSEQLNR